METIQEVKNEKLKDQDHSPLIFNKNLSDADFDEVYRSYPLTEDTTCGIGFIRGKFLQMYENFAPGMLQFLFLLKFLLQQVRQQKSFRVSSITVNDIQITSRRLSI